MFIVELALLWHVLLYSNFTIPPDNSRSPILKTECWVHWKDEAFTFFFCFYCVLICCQSFVFKNVVSGYVSDRKLVLWGLGNEVKMKCHPTVHRCPRFLLHCFIHLIDYYTEIRRVFCFQIVFAKDCGLAFYPQVTQRLPQSCATYFVVCHKLNDCFYLSKFKWTSSSLASSVLSFTL